MIARVQSFLLQGIDASPCEVEVDADDRGLNDRPVMVGLPDSGVRESIERVRSALANSGYAWPNGRVVINLAPAEVRKEGPLYDLAIAVGVLLTQGVLRPRLASPNAAGGGGPASVAPAIEPPDIRTLLFAGELALDGRVRPIRGAIAMATLARARGARGIIVPVENAAEAAVVPGIEVVGVRTLAEVVGVLMGAIEPPTVPTADVASLLKQAPAPIDFAEVRGQEGVKRAIVIAAAGGHNLLMLGPPGTGKTMMAKALPGVLPQLTPEEAIEITRVYSAAGALTPGTGLIAARPVRSPHHSASTASLVGGGMVPRPGEISLAHHGVLFLDELPEFQRDALEALRQPLEDHVVTIARAHATARFPADFMLIAAMNPTPKGDMPDGIASKRAMDHYLSRLSGPLLDRIDLHVEAPAVPWRDLSSPQRAGTGTAAMREMVERARDRQAQRQGPRLPNARLPGKQLDTLAAITPPALALLGQALQDLGLSARAYDKIRRVARTIADIAGRDAVEPDHVAEAVQYRLLDRRG